MSISKERIAWENLRLPPGELKKARKALENWALAAKATSERDPEYAELLSRTPFEAVVQNLSDPPASYGLYISIDNEEEITGVHSHEDYRPVEVAVRYRGEVREFTLAEFAERLGFNEP